MQPEIWPHLRFIWGEFWELSTERQSGMGTGPIPISKIRERSADLGFDGDDADRFITIIRQVDGEYVTLANKTKKDKTTYNEVPADDPQGVSNIFTGLQARGGRRHQKNEH